MVLKQGHTGGVVFAEQRLLSMVQDTALILTVCSHHPAAVPGTSVMSLLVKTARRIRVGSGVFEELGFKNVSALCKVRPLWSV